MTQPLIITDAVPRQEYNPAVPVTPQEQIDSTHEAFEADASMVHIHVRNPGVQDGVRNAELVRRIVQASPRFARRLASPAKARELLAHAGGRIIGDIRQR